MRFRDLDATVVAFSAVALLHVVFEVVDYVASLTHAAAIPQGIALITHSREAEVIMLPWDSASMRSQCRKGETRPCGTKGRSGAVLSYWASVGEVGRIRTYLS